jgi:hypothetical protein
MANGLSLIAKTPNLYIRPYAIRYTPPTLFFGRETNDASRTTDKEDSFFVAC